MASVVAGGIFKAVAFAGAGFLFSKLNHQGYDDEMKRHNKALEDLAKANQAWSERAFEKTNRALKLLQKSSSIDTQPTIHNFYEPSSEIKKYQDLTIGVVGLKKKHMGCKQSKQVPKVNKDVEVRRKLKIGLHLTKEEAGVQVAFGKTSGKKYETPSAQKEASESPAILQDDMDPQDEPPVPSVLKVMRRNE